ncbi:MAG: hypothetical protein ACJASL_001144, partial [Paraglaciecola sp.]
TNPSLTAGVFRFWHVKIENPRVLAGNRKLRFRVWAPLLQTNPSLTAGVFRFWHVKIENPRVLAGNRKLRFRVWAPLF